MTTKVARAHKAKLEDIARHDTETGDGRVITRSHLVRQAIARLIAGRKHALYNDRKENDNDPKPQ